jgi:hypothetical protein
MRRRAVTALVLAVLVLVAVFGLVADAVDRTKFRQCKDSGFCRRNRDRAKSPTAKIVRALGRVNKTTARGTATVDRLLAVGTAELTVDVRAYEGGVLRVTVAEANERTDGLAKRFRPDALVLRDGLAEEGLTVRPGDGGRQVVSHTLRRNAAAVVLAAPGEPFAFELRVPDQKEPLVRASTLLFEDHMKKPTLQPVAQLTEENKEKPVATEVTQHDEAAATTDHPEMAVQEEAAAAAATPPEPAPELTVDGGFDEYFGGASDTKPNGEFLLQKGGLSFSFTSIPPKHAWRRSLLLLLCGCLFPWCPVIFLLHNFWSLFAHQPGLLDTPFSRSLVKPSNRS